MVAQPQKSSLWPCAERTIPRTNVKIHFQSAQFPVGAAYLRRDALTLAHEMIRGVGGNGAAT